MKQGQKIIPRKRPPVTGTLIGVRLQPHELALLDAWIAKQDSHFTRPEAIRLHLNDKLAGKPAPAEPASAPVVKAGKSGVRKRKPSASAVSARALKAKPVKAAKKRR
jgi:hypothetical protein